MILYVIKPLMMMKVAMLSVVLLLVSLLVQVDGMDDGDFPVERPIQPKRLRSYSLRERIKIIDDYNEAVLQGQPYATSATAFARHHNIPPRTMLRWLNEEDELRDTLQAETERRCNMRRLSERNRAGKKHMFSSYI